MSVDERDRRAAAGREGVQRAPRSGGRTTGSGGRTTGQRSTTDRTFTPVSGATPASGARGARHFATQGNAALKLDTVQPSRAVEPDVKPRLQVAPPTPISVPRAPFVALVLMLVVAGVFGILLINTKTNENSFEIDRLQEQKAALDNKQQQLQRQIDAFEAPGNLHAAARKQGLVPGQRAFIRMPDGKILDPLIPATGPVSVAAQGDAATQNGTAGPDAGR